jgi:hypothetical protein
MVKLPVMGHSPMKNMLQLLVLSASLIQSPRTLPFRTGDVARQLTAGEIAAIETELPSGPKPWFLNGDPAQDPRAQFIEAYFAPTTSTPALRRGSMVWVTRRIDPLSAWTVERTQSYAQVAIPGRSFDQIQDEQDVNRPFRVIGSFDDSELVSLVKFLRSNPPTRGGPAEAIKPWPILDITRRADNSVEVRLRGAVMQGQAITLREAGQDWVIVLVGMWIA